MMFQGDEPNLALLVHLGVSKESNAWDMLSPSGRITTTEA